MKKTTSITFLILFTLCFFVTSAETKLNLKPQFAVADLSVTKTDSPDPVNTNANLTYAITVTNAGPDAAADASWSDLLPAGTSFGSLSAVAGWSCTTPANGDNGTVSCSNPSFAVGSSVFTLVVGVAPTVPAGSVLSNTATATSSTPDGNSGNDSGTAVTTVVSPASVTGNKFHSGGSSPGSTVEYLIILSNAGPSDQQDNPGNEFTDSLPAGLTLVSAFASGGTATANTGTNTVTWDGVVPAMDSVTITISATINSGTVGQTISNQGTVNYDADGNGTNEATNLTNTDSFVVGAPTASADLGVTKTANADTVLPDSDVTYTITVVNGGPDSAASVALNDTLPGTMTFVSLSSPGGWSCMTPSVGAGGLVNCTNPNLTVASGAQVFTLVGHVPSGTGDGTNFTNTATVSSSTDDPNSENNSSVSGINVANCLTDPVVTTSADSGAGSLRAAIQGACVGAVILFDMTQVTSPIALTGGELLVNKNLTIQGPGANLLTVQRSTVIGTAVFRIFNVVLSTVTISGLTITNGSALDGAIGGNNPGQNGGGISNTGTLTINSSAISGNRAGSGGSNSGSLGGIGGDGGGIFSSGPLTIISSTISDNRAGGGGNGGAGNGGRGGGGGGIASTGTLTIINSTIAGNQGGAGGTASSSGTGGTGGNGGGILSNSSATITSCTISSNQSGDGGNAGDSGAAASGLGGGLSTGIAVVNVRNSIIAANSAPTGPDIDGTVNSQDYNLIGNTTGATINGTTTHNIINQSANLGALASNGGPTPTMLPLPGSPAINAGDPANLPADDFDLDGDLNTTEELPLDQRGFARVVNANFDIGAVETNYAISATAGTPQSAMINTAFSTALRATVTESGNAQNAISVTFTAPGSGASGTFPGPSTTAVVATDTNGEATAPTFTANGTAGGPYNVIASIGTGLPTAAFALTNTKGNQTITFGALAGKTFGDPDFPVSATATSGLAVSFAATGNCTVTSPSPGTAHITGAGSCTITASQGGDANYNPAANVPQTFSIAKANQTITFGALAGQTFGDPDFPVSATATSGLAVSFAATGNCTVTSPSPGTAHLTGAGSCTITASQAGNANYNAAAPVPQLFNIAKAASATAVSSSLNPSSFGQNVTFTATVTSTAGTPTGTVQFKDGVTNLGLPQALNGSGVATFSTSSLTAGSHTITADYSGDGNFLNSTGTLAGGQVVNALTLSIDDVSVTEGNTGTTIMNFTVTLSAATTVTVNVNYATANGTATEPSDYQSAGAALTFDPGDLTKTVAVTINGDTSSEPDETFTVNLSNPVNATISDAVGTGTIQNDDAEGGFISFAQANFSVSESAGFLTITVNRSNDVSRAATVDYATSDTGAPASCDAVNGLASSRCDFTIALGTLAFSAGETTRTFSVLVNRDGYLEGPELFTLHLSSPTGGAVLVTPLSATVEITDGPGGPPPNLIDDAAFFVRQHYHDFLNREPDAGGLAFWTNQITSCGSDAQCVEVKRVNVSASFFLSIEFQETGGTSYLTNRVAFAAIPPYSRFERDSQAVGRDYIFGTPGAEAILEANKVAYFNGFVNLPDFVSIYGLMTNGQYVDNLIGNTGVNFTVAERDALVNGLNGATETRATVLRKISEKPGFRLAEFNQMFVAMEYFGYLRRDPDTDGFNFWLNKLNSFNGDYIQAEMVKAFMQSIEYRQRFGP